MIVELHAGQIANYRWSSHLTRFGRLAILESKSFAKILAAFSAGFAPWTDDVEFRSIVAMIHEIAHYLQDVTTGIGNWDFLARSETMGLVFYLLKQRYAFIAANEFRLARPYQQLLDNELNELRDKLVFVDKLRLPEPRKALLAKKISQVIGAAVSVDRIGPYLLENLLEADAVATTMKVLLRFESTDKEWEFATDNVSLWRLGDMPEVYTESLVDFLAIYERWMGDPLAEQRHQSKQSPLAIFLGLFSFLVDIACAYPSPAFFASTEKDRAEFEPGLKYFRLLVSMQRFNPQQVQRFWDGYHSDHLSETETALLENCAFPYPTTGDIYSDWAQYLAQKRASDDSRLLKMREQNSLYRAAHPDSGRCKALHSLLENKSHLIYVRSGGMVFHGTSGDFFDEKERGFYFADVSKINRDMALSEYLVHSKLFICPLAEMNVCTAVTEQCTQGLSNAQEFPIDGCLIRKAVETSGISLEGLHMNHKLDRITEAYISKSEADATKALQLALASESEDEALKLTGLEVLAFIGLKIALPILTSFAKDAIYNKYKTIKTKKEAEAAKVELLAHQDPLAPKVAKEIVVADMTKVLTHEGFSEQKAKLIVEHTYKSVESDLGLESKSAASGKP